MIETINNIQDPGERYDAATALIETLRVTLHDLAKVRRRALYEACPNDRKLPEFVQEHGVASLTVAKRQWKEGRALS
jgi:hypothetical protein